MTSTQAASRNRLATLSDAGAGSSNIDRAALPGLLALLFFVVFLLTATNFHTFDGISYIRDMGKPLAAMVLPHHLIYEPAVLGFYNLWKALGWTGGADFPAEVLSALAGAGSVAMMYKIAWRPTGVRAVAALVASGLALTYGFWFYSVEVEIYVPPLFFLLCAAWFQLRAVDEGSTLLPLLVGVFQAFAALIHQGSLFIIPAFALGLALIPGTFPQRVRRVFLYGLALGLVVVPAYLFAGIIIAGQNTPDLFIKWINHYGSLGTWGLWGPDSLSSTVSGISAAVSADYWVGRALAAALLALIMLRAVPITRNGGPFAATLWVWLLIYGVFFAWWQPENLKFWVLTLPAALLLAALAFKWQNLPLTVQKAATFAGAGAALLLVLTNAPAIWSRRDPMSDPARQVSRAVAQVTGPEDLVVLQAGSAEEYLPFTYDRINIMSTRELWYSEGGASKSKQAAEQILKREWHALSKGANVLFEDRVLLTGEQKSDHYVFTPAEIEALLSPYGKRLTPELVQAGPETFYRLSPLTAYSTTNRWDFSRGASGWSGVNVAEEQAGKDGYCFSPLADPNLYGPPISANAASLNTAEIEMSSTSRGKAQLFYRGDPATPYSEKASVSFTVEPGEHTYRLPLGGAPGWKGLIRGLRFDPVDIAAPGARICIKGISLTGSTLVTPGNANTR